jgi:hypothetical protein
MFINAPNWNPRSASNATTGSGPRLIPVLMISPFSLYVTGFFCFFSAFTSVSAFTSERFSAKTGDPHIRRQIANKRVFFLIRCVLKKIDE